jgi:hypothetical protein
MVILTLVGYMRILGKIKRTGGLMENEVKPALFALDKAATILGEISPWTLRKHAHRKHIRVVRLGQRVFLDANEIDRIRREGLPRLTAKRSRKP